MMNIPNKRFQKKSRFLSVILTTMAILMPAKLLAQCPDSNHPHMIDLGLPSETKWSCCNMDAETPESYGGYYSWGETEVKDSYEYETYKFFTSWSDSPWYQNIGRVITRTEYDVAYTKWGDAWQMPTEGQIQELIDNTTAVWTTQNGVVGTLFTGINGNSIFLPASATRWGTNTPELGTTGFYWSSELRNTDQTTPYILQINSEGVQLLENKERCSGVLVRPVTPQIHSTYTGAEGGIVERVNNGNLESDEYYNFAYTGESTTTELQATDIVADPDDATNHCIKLVKGHDWDYPDFHIKVSANSVSLYPGQKYTFSMRVKASQTTQIHSSGLGSWGQLRIDGMIGSFDVTTEWTTINYEGVVTDAQAGVGQLAFVFNDSAPVEYYFDDITFQVETGDTFVSSCEGGTDLIFTVVSEDEQTCAIGDFLGRNEDGIHWAMTEIGVAGTLTLPSTVEHNGITYSVKFVGDGALAENTLFDTIIIPDGITYVGPDAFWITDALKSISIPKTVKGLGVQAFSNCYNLEKVYCYIEEPFIIEETMFSTNSNWTTATLYVPAGCKPKYEATEGWNLFQNIVEMADPYAVLSDGNTVLTFYYDDQKTARGGMDVGPFDTSDSQSWYDERESITSVVFDASFAGCTTLTSTAWWFNQLNNLTTITGINYLKTDNVTSMRSMFHRCSSLTSLDLSSFNTENVTVMQDMFSSCTALTSLDLSNFNTENVTDMQEMFLSCSALTALDLSSFNTANVTKMGAMFEQCEALTSLNVSSFNTINVTDMYEMFRDTALPSLDLSNFNTTNVTDMGQMFDGCSALTSIDVSSFNTANVSDIHRMFYDCSHLETIYVGNDWSTASVTSGDGMFTNCTALVGGKGTTYDENHTDYTYAHIDGGTTNPGYFTDKNAVDATFDSMGVLTVGGSTTMTDALEAVGGGAEVAKTITAIVWNSTETLTNSDLQGLDNPNMLIFVNEASVAPDHSNVVIDGQAKEIILKDVTEGNNNWYCPQPFTAEKISYTRTFSQQTKIGVSRGWETIALPFDVQTISHATQGIISPFGNYSGNYNFWLRTLTQNGLQSVQEIKANTPYIISMPNSSEYPVEYNLAGEVTFSAENAFVPETENYFVESENYAMAPIFMYIEAKEELYVLNVGEERNNHPEGSIFERNYRAVRPFEAATQHMNPSRFAPQFISVADLGGGDDTTELQELKNGRMEELKYYDLQGRRVLKPSKGVYIQNGNKVIIK